jgi:ferredoxin--NADP+ reductase
VRMGEELAYQDALFNLPVHPELSALVPNLAQRFTYIPVVTRQVWPGALLQRITILADNGELERTANLPWSKVRSRFMLCGNPEMVQELRQVLKQKGFSPARRNAPGEVAVENYW